MKQNTKVPAKKKGQYVSIKQPAAGNSKLFIVVSIVIIGFALSVIFHYCMVYYFNLKNYPNNTFLYIPYDRFNDFYSTYKVSANLDPYGSSASYFPLAFIFMYLFTFFPANFAFGIFTITFITFCFIYFYRNVPGLKVFQKVVFAFVLSFMSYPILFIIDRGNLEAWIFIAIVLFIHFYQKEKHFLAILFLSVAIAFKLYPGILLLLYLADKKYKFVLYACLTTFVLSLGSAAMLHGGVAATKEGLKAGLGSVSNVMAFGYHGVQHSTSFFAPMRLLLDYVLIRKDALTFENDIHFYNYYYLFALVVFAIVAIIFFAYRMPLWKRVALLVLLYISLPQISFDYKLISISIPLVLFITSTEVSKFNPYYAVLFGLILIPKDYYVIVVDITSNIIINPVLIFLLILLILTDTLKFSKRKKSMQRVEVGTGTPTMKKKQLPGDKVSGIRKLK